MNLDIRDVKLQDAEQIYNTRARKLYKKFEFQEEGILKCSALRNGQYSDEIVMARINY